MNKHLIFVLLLIVYVHSQQCGNKMVDTGEQCDRSAPGYNLKVDGPCNQNCQSTCSNGILEKIYGQQCVFVSGATPQTCDDKCQLLCGNKILDTSAGEQCDITADPTIPCTDDCSLCGNGQVDTSNSEQCDPSAPGSLPCKNDCTKSCGNDILQTQLGQQCDTTSIPCKVDQCILTCGNGIIDQASELRSGSAQTCDPKYDSNPAGFCNPILCTDTCTTDPSVLNPGQECQDGFNTIPCLDCQKTCGNGIINSMSYTRRLLTASGVGPASNPAEQCDYRHPNWSQQTCHPIFCVQIANIPQFVENVCGNGIVETYDNDGDGNNDQQCDDGDNIDDNACSNACTLNPTCGNKQLDQGQQCQISFNLMFCQNCLVTLPGCGNGVIDNTQQCDDNNNINGDGCSAFCFLEEGFICQDGLCSKCGNRVIDRDQGETCDDGNRVSGDTCNSVCQLQVNQNCGDQLKQADEDCDDGNNISGDGCDVLCRVQPGFVCQVDIFGRSLCGLCGNGLLNSGQQCDDFNSLSGDGCFQCQEEDGWQCNGIPSICIREPTKFCGDGLLDPVNEVCDDGDTINSNGCTRTCQVTPGFQCTQIPNEKSQCYPKDFTQCGNGKLEAGQECDDENLQSGDGCSSNCKEQQNFICDGSSGEKSQCKPYVSCPNGIRESDRFQSCDDGNSISGDGCSPSCQVQLKWSCFQNSEGLSSCFKNPQQPTDEDDNNPVGPVCGNFFQSGEDCDDGNKRSGDGCSSRCIVEQFYTCSRNIGFRSQCRYFKPPVCGDKQLQFGQECQDGNAVSGDGCNSECQAEEGYQCLFVGVPCTKLCGNGFLNPGEECDDYDQQSGDGCSSECEVQDSYRCKVFSGNTYSTCRRTCGNRELESNQFNEQCDDGNTNSGDGCDLNCKVQEGFYCTEIQFALSFCSKKIQCGNGIAQDVEDCDDGNNLNGDGCNQQCQIQSATHRCFVSGESTYCEQVTFCRNGYPLPQTRLSDQAISALRVLNLNVQTYSGLVQRMIIMNNGFMVKDVNIINQISTLFVISGITSQWLRVDNIADHCVA